MRYKMRKEKENKRRASNEQKKRLGVPLAKGQCCKLKAQSERPPLAGDLKIA